MAMVDSNQSSAEVREEQTATLPLQSGPCPQCGSRERVLTFDDERLEARCLSCGAATVAWHDLFVAW